MRFKDKVAVVAGGGGGIGQGIAVALGAEGAKVAIWDVNEDGLSDTQKKIEEKGGKALVMKVDCLQYDKVKDAVDKVMGQFGQIDIMVCTIGGGKFKPLRAYTPEFWKQQLDYNLTPVFNCNHAVIEPMVKRNYGKILNFITGMGGGSANLAAYGASKAAVRHFTESMALELMPYHINVNCMRPGTVLTPLTLGAFRAMGPEGEKRMEAVGKSGWGFNTVENAAKVALFLVSDDAQRLSGLAIDSK